jgi:hypothetical protein
VPKLKLKYFSYIAPLKITPKVFLPPYESL